MEIKLVYRGDIWLTRSSLDLIGVCETKSIAVQMAKEDAADALLFEKLGDAISFGNELYEKGQCVVNGVGYLIETAEMNKAI